jgi:hypothetical protein
MQNPDIYNLIYKYYIDSIFTPLHIDNLNYIENNDNIDYLIIKFKISCNYNKNIYNIKIPFINTHLEPNLNYFEYNNDILFIKNLKTFLYIEIYLYKLLNKYNYKNYSDSHILSKIILFREYIIKYNKIKFIYLSSNHHYSNIKYQIIYMKEDIKNLYIYLILIDIEIDRHINNIQKLKHITFLYIH